MMKRLIFSAVVILLGTFVTGCDTSGDNANTIANADFESVAATRSGPDNSEITRTTDANGVVTETRVFHDNQRISRVVVTTNNNGTRTARAYSPSGEEREISGVENALDATGDALATAAGFVADKAEDVAEGTVEGSKTIGEKTVDTAEKIGDRTSEGAKKVGKKTAEGAKKAGKTIKDAVTP